MWLHGNREVVFITPNNKSWSNIVLNDIQRLWISLVWLFRLELLLMMELLLISFVGMTACSIPYTRMDLLLSFILSVVFFCFVFLHIFFVKFLVIIRASLYHRMWEVQNHLVYKNMSKALNRIGMTRRFNLESKNICKGFPAVSNCLNLGT